MTPSLFALLLIVLGGVVLVAAGLWRDRRRRLKEPPFNLAEFMREREQAADVTIQNWQDQQAQKAPDR